MKFMVRTFIFGIITSLVVLSSFGNSVFSSENRIINTNIGILLYRQELILPIDTGQEAAWLQPVDIRINFENNCWAKDEIEHSVRICYDDGSGLTEIESQIYDLEFISDSHISACSVVFLIPDGMDGTEIYYICYHDTVIEASDYEDHIQIEDTHYFYEPISGQKMDFDYYKVVEDGYVIYAVLQKGELIGNPIAQGVMKFKPKTTEVETNFLQQLAAFDMRYGIVEQPAYKGSSWADKVSKSVMVDGNLMARMRIDCTSPTGIIRTDNIYTYYYSPTDTKRIIINAHHEVLKTHQIEEPSLLDGVYAGLTSTKSRSATIEKMNVGDILPSLRVYAEDETIKDYAVPPNPQSEQQEPILTTEDDIDLGTKAWVCLNNPSTGEAQGIIFHSNTGFVEELDGLQVKSYVKQNIKLPGLEGDTGNVYVTRNAFETGGSHITILNQGFSIKFEAEFITFQTEGYEAVDKESIFFQQLTTVRPVFPEEITEVEEEGEKYSLTTYVHLAPSFPMGSLLSAALGKNFPYIYAELYKENSIKSSGSVGRLPIGSIELDFEGKTFIGKIKTIIGIFDWKSASFFKKIRFTDLEEGKYLVKIYRENRIFGRERQYIGFLIVDVTKDIVKHIFCRPEGLIRLSSHNQDGNSIKDVTYQILRDDVIISEMQSDENGKAEIGLPCYINNPYKLKVLYDGFLVLEKQVKIGLHRRFIPLKESFEIPLYNLELTIKDNWDFIPYIDVNPWLTSNEMVEELKILPEKVEDGFYRFNDLYPTEYKLYLSYKSTRMETPIKIKKDESINIIFPATFKLDLHLFNSFGMDLDDAEVSITRLRKNAQLVENTNNLFSFNVPPGEYKIIIKLKNKEIAKQKIIILGDKSTSIVTKEGSQIHDFVIYVGIAILILSIFLLILKRNFPLFLSVLSIAIIIIALVTPWWILTGENSSASTVTKTYLIPSTIITLTSSNEVIGGDISQIPDELHLLLNLLMIMLVLVSIFIVINIAVRYKLKKTSLVLSILSVVLIFITVFVFYYGFSQLTNVGVGSFLGSGKLAINIPGGQDQIMLPCSWGPGIGFYLASLVIVFLTIILIKNKVKKLLNKKI